MIGLYKGKRLEDGVWVFGSLNLCDGGKIAHISNINPGPKDVWAFNYEVDPKTVCSYFGLEFCQSKIYEGDKLRVHQIGLVNQGEETVFVGVISFNESLFLWEIEIIEYEEGVIYEGGSEQEQMKTWPLAGLDMSEGWVEILGNIHDESEGK